MVKLMGHLAMGLLFATPAWFVWDGRVSLAFVAFALSTVMVPDVDLVLRHVFPTVEHHGVTHTVAFVALVAIVAGIFATRVLAPVLERWWVKAEDHRVPEPTLVLFVTGGLLAGGLSHVFADMLSAPDIAQSVTPLWPVVTEPISFDVIYYASIWWNVGLLVVAVAVHLLLASLDAVPVRTRFRVGES